MIQLDALLCDCEHPTIAPSSAPIVEWVLEDEELLGDREPLLTSERPVVIDQLAAFGVETLRLTGTSGLDAVDELIERADDHGLETTLRTSGQQLDQSRLESLADSGLTRVSVLVEGLSTPREQHTSSDAIDAALETLRAADDTDLATELRFPLQAESVTDMEEIYDLAALLSADRFRLTHVPEPELDEEQRRRAVRRLADLARDAHERGTHLETVLSGGIDAGYVAEYAQDRLEEACSTDVREALRERLGTAPSPPVAKLGPAGRVYPGPFWDRYALGSVRDRPFGSIWTDESNPLLERLRHEEAGLPDRCRGCQFGDICSGGSRGRALAVHDDPFEPDPVCYVDKEAAAGGSPAESTAD
ncbi:radical SAM protein [Halapricum hydrolyticum]|uniref:Radical SAM protein n=1 Tax=Halapricum hydrolyticum TaxID=2979991 RepID=A0AAE3IC18_9EURY|nr:radical SAM protein [Halapricum hydrolyticum]MCU4718311.1 radical SAM protein [Halapricum hydrolyticum]MCU4727241.1 radical SAM protein [Halapricum hydrolyticum]